MTDPVEIAKGLTKWQIKHLPIMQPDFWHPADNRGGMYLELMMLGIVQRKSPREARYSLTPLGIAVQRQLSDAR